MMRKPTKPAKPRPSGARRGKLVPISEEMQHWSAMLQGELDALPGVSTKFMFGFLSYYRGKTIFAALPRSRAFNSGSSLIFKFDPMPEALFARAQRDDRINKSTKIPGKGRFWFELRSEADLRDALWWLNQAYECVKQGSARRKR